MLRFNRFKVPSDHSPVIRDPLIQLFAKTRYIQELECQDSLLIQKGIGNKGAERNFTSKEIKRIHQYKYKICEVLGNNPISFKNQMGYTILEITMYTCLTIGSQNIKVDYI